MKLSLPEIKCCRAALNHVFALAGIDLAANRVINRMFRSFEKNLLSREIKLPEWNLSLVVRSLTHSPCEP